MEFKNLAEVELLGEVPEGASVLAATADGDVVRVPGEGLGGGGSKIIIRFDDGVFTIEGSTFAEAYDLIAAGGTIVGSMLFYNGNSEIVCANIAAFNSETPFVVINTFYSEFYLTRDGMTLTNPNESGPM